MAYYKADRYEVRLIEEAHGSFGAAIADVNTWDLTASGQRVRCTKADPTGLTREAITDEAALLRPFDRRPPIMGPLGGALTFSTYATGKGSGTPGAALLWSRAFGAYNESTSTAVTGAGSTTTVIDVTSAADITAGDLVLIGGEVREVTAVNVAATPDNITLNMALSGIPAAATPVTCYRTHYPSFAALADPSDSTYKSLAALFRGAGADRYECLGCQPSLGAITCTPGQLLNLDWSLAVNSWSLVGDPGDPSADAVDDGEVLAIGGYVFLQEVGTTTRNAVEVAEWSFDPGLRWEALPSPAGSQGRAAWICTGQQASLRLKVHPHATTYDTAFTAGTAYQIICQLGTTANGTWALYACQAVVAEQPKRADAAGLTAIDVTFMLREGQEAGDTTDILKSPFRVALL